MSVAALRVQPAARAPLRSLRLPLAGLAAALSLGCAVAGSYPGWRLGAALLALCGVAVVGGLVAVRTRLGAFSPGAVFLASGLLYTAPVGVTLAVHGLFISDREFTESGLVNATWIAACALATAAAAYLAGRLRPAPPRRPARGALGTYDPTAAGVVAVGMMVAGSAALMLLMLRLGGVSALAGARYGERALMMRGLGPLAVGLQGVIVGGGVLYLNAVRGAWRLTAPLVLVGLVGALALWTGLMESRAALIQGVLLLMVVRQTSGRPLRLRTVLVMSVLLLLLGVLVSMRRALRENFRLDLNAVPGWAFNPANTEFGAAAVTLADVAREVPRRIPYRYGGTYLELPSIAVPLALWRQRPPAPGEWYAATFYPSEWEQGGAYAFSPVAEAWLNFGMAGVVLVFATLGLLLARLEARLLRDPVLAAWPALAYGLAVPYLLTFFRLDLASFVKSYCVLTLLPLLLAAACAHLIAFAASRVRAVAGTA
jgi:hypothetical protein